MTGSMHVCVIKLRVVVTKLVVVEIRVLWQNALYTTLLTEEITVFLSIAKQQKTKFLGNWIYCVLQINVL